jgi:hypothetical protein
METIFEFPGNTPEEVKAEAFRLRETSTPPMRESWAHGPGFEKKWFWAEGNFRVSQWETKISLSTPDSSVIAIWVAKFSTCASLSGEVTAEKFSASSNYTLSPQAPEGLEICGYCGFAAPVVFEGYDCTHCGCS